MFKERVYEALGPLYVVNVFRRIKGAEYLIEQIGSYDAYDMFDVNRLRRILKNTLSPKKHIIEAKSLWSGRIV